ncbi:MAG: hypothetical protein HY823_00555 [Acidobacteria bacterium]|nr:hypothetical protein [Acidobacteriota bacterium]
MNDLAPSVPCPAQAAPLSLLSALSGAFFGLGAIALGAAQSSSALVGFGVASLLQLPLSLSLWARIRAGLGNRGLERELRIFRFVSVALRLLALCLAVVGIGQLLDRQAPEPGLAAPGLALLALSLLALLWRAKLPLAEAHPSLALDGARARVQVELAAILLAGVLAGRWFPLADGATALALALRLYLAGRSMALLGAVKAACGGCGSGCGC